MHSPLAPPPPLRRHAPYLRFLTVQPRDRSSPRLRSAALTRTPLRTAPQFKRADVSQVLSVCAVLLSPQQLVARFGTALGATDALSLRLSGYQLFTEAVRGCTSVCSCSPTLHSGMPPFSKHSG
jgi:hypothetical protein